MIPVTTAAQARALDAAFVARLGLPSIVLMETASRALADAVRAHPASAGRVVVVCGPGNNGGDGYGCARWLAGRGVAVAVWSLAPRSSGDAALQRAACAAAGVPEVDGVGGATLVVDAIFGTGLSRPVSGPADAAIAAIEAANVPVIAADVPSGVCADTGAVLGRAVRAVATVTFGTLKPGLRAGPGASLAGQVTVADLGFGALAAGGGAGARRGGALVVAADPPPGAGAALAHERPAVGSRGPEGAAARLAAIGAEVERSDVAGRWPARGLADHKGRSGHLVVIAGSVAMAGAAVLVCRGALAAGVGLVTLVAPGGALPRLAALPPEVMVRALDDGATLSSLPDAALAGATALAVGPGLGGGGPVSPALADRLRALWSTAPVPLVYDADALPCAGAPGPGPRVLTPHPGEAARLLGCPIAEVEADRFAAVAALSARGTALLKGRFTLIAGAGAPILVNPTGAPVLATGGAGDVLTGVIGALLARGVGATEAAVLAAWVHGRAGEALAARRAVGWTASDIAAEIPEILVELRR